MRRRGGLAAVLAVLAIHTGAGAGTAGDRTTGGETNPVFGYADAIRERVFIESPYDSDKNNVKDIIAIDIKRPKATNEGLKAPVIMDPSPYYSTLGRGNESQLKRDFDGDGLLDLWPLFYDNYFVPRGYAVILMDMIGTNNSTGCPTVHDDLRQPEREGRDRLAQRPDPGRRQERHAGRRVLAQRQDRPDRQVLRRHARQRGRGVRRRGPDARSSRSRRSPPTTTTRAPTASSSAATTTSPASRTR